VTQTVPDRTSADFGPPLRGRHRRLSGRRRLLRYGLTTAFLLVFVTVIGIGGFALLGATGQTVDIGSLGREENPPSGEEPALLQEVEGVTNILLVGSDSREGLTDDELLALGTDDDGRGPTGLTDTLMLVQLDADDDRASVLSFPRDLLVTHCDGTRGRINAAFRYGEELEPGGGPNCLVETVEDLTSIPIDHYVQVDFQGFIQAVDQLGGVSFYLDEPIEDRYAGLDLPAGCVQLDGAEALAFVRARHVDSDFGRIARQQRFIREMLDQATSLETLANPSRLLGFVQAVGNAITTDSGLASPFDRASLAWSFRQLTNAGVDTYSVPGFDDTWNGAQVITLDEGGAEPLFALFRQGSIGSSSVLASPQPSAAAGEAASPSASAGATVAPVSPSASPSPEPTFAGAARSDVAC
jgi:LCP family protein required for cell wall assembly